MKQKFLQCIPNVRIPVNSTIMWLIDKFKDNGNVADKQQLFVRWCPWLSFSILVKFFTYFNILKKKKIFFPYLWFRFCQNTVALIMSHPVYAVMYRFTQIFQGKVGGGYIQTLLISEELSFSRCLHLLFHKRVYFVRKFKIHKVNYIYMNFFSNRHISGRPTICLGFCFLGIVE